MPADPNELDYDRHAADLEEMAQEVRTRKRAASEPSISGSAAVISTFGQESSVQALERASSDVAPSDPDRARALAMQLRPSRDKGGPVI